MSSSKVHCSFVALIAVLTMSACSTVRSVWHRPAQTTETTPVVVEVRSPPPAPVPEPEPVRYVHEDAALFADAAVTAWAQFERLWSSKTGLARATPDYNKLTPWDIASVLAANYSGHRLGLLDDAAYVGRMQKTLRTLQQIPLYRKAVFNKTYIAETGRMAGRSGGVSTTGYGWSATDLGRLLVWLKIVARNDTMFQADVQRVVDRIKLEESTAKGYMVGGMIGSRGQLWKFQEGRVGYEQYAAHGFDFWGANVDSALDLKLNARPVDVLGVPILADRRGLDRLNSEPMILIGLELGFDSDLEQLARNVLAAQQARFEKTGNVTMASEDALNIPPHFFYYYCVYCNGVPFTIDVATPGKKLDKPRWVSTKATFGYHALMPSPYTKRALTLIEKARDQKGWSSGVFEANGKSTLTYDLNTAAVILEAALFVTTGRPLIDQERD